MLAGNHREVAEWILGKFKSYGYTEIRLDSFLLYLNYGGGTYSDTTWQYNIVCTLAGSTALVRNMLLVAIMTPTAMATLTLLLPA
jgi:hypothetical protein